MGGSGKSAVAALLRRRGYHVFDTDDVPGLARWEDLATKKPIHVDHSGFIDYTKVAWNWDPEVLDALLNSSSEVLICGSASNQQHFYDHFNKIFVLVVDPKTHEQRLRSRKSEYGKHPKMMRQIIRDHQALTHHMSNNKKVTFIDTNRKIENVVDDILGAMTNDH
jgi:dephospho-CoA kinase